MLLTRRLPESAVASRPLRCTQPTPCSTQQLHVHSRLRPIVHNQAQQQPEQHPQQMQLNTASTVAGQQISAGATAAAQLSVTQALQQSKSAAALLLLLKLQSKWQQLALWCKQRRVQQLLWGGDGASALAAMSVMPLLPGNGFSDLFTNRVFLAGFWAWFTAQTLKIFTKYLKKGVWDLKAIVDSGGMPSSHSALCAGITTAIAFQHGMGSSAFALAVALSSIVMYDAAGVRRHAGKQAEVLNQVIGELLEGHPVSDVKLKEVLGHTPLQVGCGAVLGVLFGIFYPTPEPLAAHLLVAT